MRDFDDSFYKNLFCLVLYQICDHIHIYIFLDIIIKSLLMLFELILGVSSKLLKFILSLFLGLLFRLAPFLFIKIYINNIIK